MKQLIKFILMLILLHNNLILSQIWSQQQPITSRDLRVLPFSVDPYCEAIIVKDEGFQNCRSEELKRWSPINGLNKRKYTCCYNWDLIDCMEKTLIQRCTSTQFDSQYLYLKFLYERENWLHFHEKHKCVGFGYKSFACHFPWWAILLIAFACVLLLCIIIVVCVYWRKRHKKSITKL